LLSAFVGRHAILCGSETHIYAFVALLIQLSVIGMSTYVLEYTRVYTRVYSYSSHF
jgi:hypothetical protein